MALMWQPMLRHKVAQPIGASSQKASYDKKADKRTSTEQDATTLQHEFGSYAFREWEGEKGETYHIEASGEATPWTCTLLEKNGHSKKFKVYPDEASGKIWWGQGWTFFCNLRAEEAHQTLALSWYRPGARTPSFVWWAQPEAPAGPGRAAEDGARPARAAPPGGRAAAGLPRWRPKPAAAPRPEAEGAGGAPSAGPGGGAAEGPAEGGGGAGGGGEAARGAPPEPGGGAAAVAGPPEPVGAGCGSQARSIANLREQLEEEERRQAAVGGGDILGAPAGSEPPRGDGGDSLKPAEAFRAPPGLELPPGLVLEALPQGPAQLRCGQCDRDSPESPEASVAAQSTDPRDDAEEACERHTARRRQQRYEARQRRRAAPGPGEAPIDLRAGSTPGCAPPPASVGGCRRGPPKPAPHEDDETGPGSTDASHSDDLDCETEPWCGHFPQPPQQAPPLEGRGHEFTVTVDKRSGVALGAKMEIGDGDDAVLRITRIMKMGLLPLWNAANPGRAVMANDCIVGVNGRRGSTAILVAQLQLLQVQEIAVRREAPPAEGRALVAGGPLVAAAGAPAAPRPAAAALGRTGQAFLAACRLRGPLDGRWFDVCGPVGTIEGSAIHWAQQADDADGTTKVALSGATVHMNFLGEQISGILRDNRIIWSSNDVWWRND